MEVIVKVLQKIIDLYRIVTLQHAVYVSFETGKVFDDMWLESRSIKTYISELGSASEDMVTAIRKNVDDMSEKINEKYDEFSKIKTYKIHKDDMDWNLVVIKKYFASRYSISRLKDTLKEMNDFLKTIKTKVSTEQDTKKIECYGKMVTSIVKIITATSRILYRPVNTDFA